MDDYAVGCRKDLNGILLLDTALQPPVAKPEDVVQLELPVTEVSQEREHGQCSVSSDKVPPTVGYFLWKVCLLPVGLFNCSEGFFFLSRRML